MKIERIKVFSHIQGADCVLRDCQPHVKVIWHCDRILLQVSRVRLDLSSDFMTLMPMVRGHAPAPRNLLCGTRHNYIYNDLNYKRPPTVGLDQVTLGLSVEAVLLAVGREGLEVAEVVPAEVEDIGYCTLALDIALELHGGPVRDPVPLVVGHRHDRVAQVLEDASLHDGVAHRVACVAEEVRRPVHLHGDTKVLQQDVDVVLRLQHVPAGCQGEGQRVSLLSLQLRYLHG